MAMGEVESGLVRAGRISAGAVRILSGSGGVTDGQLEPRTGRVRFTATAGIGRLLAGAPRVRAALLEEGVPASAFGGQSELNGHSRAIVEFNPDSSGVSLDNRPANR